MALIGADDSGWFPNLKLFLLKPSIIFDRMKNQQGNFIYQLYYEKGKK
ncbi:MAG: hypothetical protein E6346_11495 [Lactococcus lactis]|uniref:Uncharacterized protein n=1 Tax=Lactococcus cremoris subsp. cremoris TIFN3 TaxID=1234873 RepID=T0VH79_LACLC|nr:hypothetical protein [Lactococcus cremoris]EQC95142.1 hypothetical protein LLT3_05195 [Lactococcus cremoris subsp. cremoris TIFN3]MDU4517692.1 hypothetical protein [Lactococcus lactis]MDU7039945.1 hypothetical protein [Lactococcus lactis]UXV62319.1 hypothetical protein LLUC047_06450 [Lactococcus cremoris]WKB12473.1 hypothetical protein LL1196_03275 [Lactococcus cremoris]